MFHDAQDLLAFGPYVLDSGQRLLFRAGVIVPLEPKVFDTLLVLVQASGRAVTKDDLLSTVWPDSFVEEGSLARNVSTLRKTLGTDDEPEGYIETLARRGYRFRAAVRRFSPSAPSPSTSAPTPNNATTLSVSTLPPPVVASPFGRRTSLSLGYAVIVLVAAFTLAFRSSLSPAVAQPTAIRSIAVLPLLNLSGDPDQEFFSEGMTEALITQLSTIPALSVTSRTSVMRYKSAPPPLPMIAETLGVDAIVEGSVQRSGAKLRISIQVIKAATDTHLLARQFDGTIDDVFELQTQVARAIVDDIAGTLRSPQSFRPSRPARVSPDAYDAYLLGQHLFWKGDEAALRQAIVSFERAIALQPDFAAAYAGLAMTWQGMRFFDIGTNEKSRTAARKAIELDDELAEAHAALAGAAVEDWDWDTAVRESELALQLNPYSLEACSCYGVVLATLGRQAEAIPLVQRGLSINPLSSGAHANAAAVFLLGRQYAEAEAHAKRALELEPNNLAAPTQLLEVYTLTGRGADALAFVSTAKVSPALEATADIAAGRREEALALLARIESTAPTRDALIMARNFLRLGDEARGFTWLAKAVDARLGPVAYINVNPAFDRWRNDPRFVAQVQRLKLPATQPAAATD